MVITDSSRSRLNGLQGIESWESGLWRKHLKALETGLQTTLYREVPSEGSREWTAGLGDWAREALSCSLVGICKWIRGQCPSTAWGQWRLGYGSDVLEQQDQLGTRLWPQTGLGQAITAGNIQGGGGHGGEVLGRKLPLLVSQCREEAGHS